MSGDRRSRRDCGVGIGQMRFETLHGVNMTAGRIRNSRGLLLRDAV